MQIESYSLQKTSRANQLNRTFTGVMLWNAISVPWIKIKLYITVYLVAIQTIIDK